MMGLITKSNDGLTHAFIHTSPSFQGLRQVVSPEEAMTIRISDLYRFTDMFEFRETELLLIDLEAQLSDLTNQVINFLSEEHPTELEMPVAHNRIRLAQFILRLDEFRSQLTDEMLNQLEAGTPFIVWLDENECYDLTVKEAIPLFLSHYDWLKTNVNKEVFTKQIDHMLMDAIIYTWYRETLHFTDDDVYPFMNDTHFQKVLEQLIIEDEHNSRSLVHQLQKINQQDVNAKLTVMQRFVKRYELKDREQLKTYSSTLPFFERYLKLIFDETFLKQARKSPLYALFLEDINRQLDKDLKAKDHRKLNEVAVRILIAELSANDNKISAESLKDKLDLIKQQHDGLMITPFVIDKTLEAFVKMTITDHSSNEVIPYIEYLLNKHVLTPDAISVLIDHPLFIKHADYTAIIQQQLDRYEGRDQHDE